jgi:hypothetical protein
MSLSPLDLCLGAFGHWPIYFCPARCAVGEIIAAVVDVPQSLKKPTKQSIFIGLSLAYFERLLLKALYPCVERAGDSRRWIGREPDKFTQECNFTINPGPLEDRVSCCHQKSRCVYLVVPTNLSRHGKTIQKKNLNFFPTHGRVSSALSMWWQRARRSIGPSQRRGSHFPSRSRSRCLPYIEYGADFVLSLSGCSRMDIPSS